MALKQTYEMNQKQIQGLALTQEMKQSILVLQNNLLELNEYVKEKSMENPLFEVNPNIQKQEVEALFQYSIKDKQSLYDYLIEQVMLTMRATKLRSIVLALISRLDEHGYLVTLDSMLQQELGISSAELADAKELLYNLDPPGVGAQSLQECLILQGNRKKATTLNLLVIQLLQDYFEDVVDHNWNKISQSLGIDITAIKNAFQKIQTLSPYPYSEDFTGTRYIVPEVIIKNEFGKLSLSVTKYGYPNIIFAQKTYTELKKVNDRQIKAYIREKYQQYQAIIASIDKRINTVSLVASVILEKQYQFFNGKSSTLNPLLLRDVAHELGLSESTISRTVNNKYIQTDFGIFELKSFFTRRSRPNSDLSASAVREMIAVIIKQEKPNSRFSDQAITKILAQQGIEIARRTIAKYRTQLGILPASKR